MNQAAVSAEALPAPLDTPGGTPVGATLGKAAGSPPVGATPVAIVGGGTAGMLAALALADTGAHPLLLDAPPARRAGQVCPVHRLPEALWLAPPRWLRGLGAALRSVGATGGDRHLVTATKHHRHSSALLPDKSMLDAALRLLVRGQAGLTRRTLQHAGIAAVDGRWQLHDAADDLVHETPLLVDATGARRASLPALAAACARLPGSEVCEGRQTYRTLALQRSGGQPRACWMITEGAGQAWLLDLMHDGSITLTERVPVDDLSSRAPDGAAPDRTAGHLLDRLRRCLERLRIEPLRFAMQRAEPAGAPASYRAPAARRTVLAAPAQAAQGAQVTEAARTAPAWLAVGDALVHTPPWLGQGVAQARQQADTLACAWAESAAPCRAHEARARLDRLAARQLRSAALAAWAEGGAQLPA